WCAATCRPSARIAERRIGPAWRFARPASGSVHRRHSAGSTFTRNVANLWRLMGIKFPRAERTKERAANDSGFSPVLDGIAFGEAPRLTEKRRRDGARLVSGGGASAWHDHAALGRRVGAGIMPRAPASAAALRDRPGGPD